MSGAVVTDYLETACDLLDEIEQPDNPILLAIAYALVAVVQELAAIGESVSELVQTVDGLTV